MRHGHISAGEETTFHDHADPATTHYPGAGLDAATEAFNAYKLWHEKYVRLNNDQVDRYLVEFHKYWEEYHGPYNERQAFT